jgi:ubiquinone/menaquinone biosynthesis C-methylase UbiE
MTDDAAPNQARINKILKYAVSFADSNPIIPPEIVASELVNSAEFKSSREVLAYLAKISANHDELGVALARDNIPIPASTNREGYAPGRDLGYWVSGYAEFKMIESIAKEYGITGGRYFDFGGSTGRVFRHFSMQRDCWDVWSCDFKISSVDFNMKYYPTSIRTFLNTAYPVLPIPDSYFDLISACSVFTHINETETSWLLELRRVMKVGGIAYITILNDESWIADKAIRLSAEKHRPDIAAEPKLPAGKTVITFREDDPYNCNVLHSNDYIRTNWGRYFEVCEIRGPHLLHQATVVCRRID